MESTERAELYRRRAAEMEQKAETAGSEHMRRAWLIIARDWKTMAQVEELKYLEGPAPSLIPKNDDLEQAIRQLASLEQAIRQLASKDVTLSPTR